MATLKRIFSARGYISEEPTYHISPPDESADGLWRIHSQCAHGTPVLAVLTNAVQTVGDVMDVEEFSDQKDTTGNTSAKFVSDLVKECRNSGVSALILVSDNITAPAAKAILAVQHLHLTSFAYKELCAGAFDAHMFQPMKIERGVCLKEEEYQPIQARDILMRFHGFRAGDTLRVEEADRQSGVAVSYLKVI